MVDFQGLIVEELLRQHGGEFLSRMDALCESSADGYATLSELLPQLEGRGIGRDDATEILNFFEENGVVEEPLVGKVRHGNTPFDPSVSSAHATRRTGGERNNMTSKRLNSELLPSYPFIKARDLIGKTFTTISNLRKGETKQGLNYFVDIEVGGEKKTLSFGATSAAGKQIARNESVMVKGMALTIEVGKPNPAFPTKPPYLFAVP